MQVSATGVQEYLSTDAMLSGVRIARVSTVPFFVLSQLKHQIEALRDSGAQPTIITSNGAEFPALEAITGVQCKPIEIPRSLSPWLDLMSLWQLFCFFRDNHIHIAHSTTPKAGLLTAVAAFLAGVPVRLHTFTGQPWVNLKGPMHWLARWSDWLIGKLNTRCYADSESQQRFLVEQGILPAKRLFVIGAGSLAGIDIKRFDSGCFSAHERIEMRAKTGVPEDAQVLLFVGRITVDKGIRELMSAFRIIKASGSTAHLVLVGPFDEGGDEIKGILTREIESVPDTHTVGFTECPEAYMAIADILCLPSYREGFGTVVIEAASMGVPTVGTDIYGLSDAVVNGETGILVPPRDSVALGEALTFLLKNKSRRMQMGQAAWQRAVHLFDGKQVNNLLIEEYRSLLHAVKAN